MFRAPPKLSKPLLTSMEKAIWPAEPTNGTSQVTTTAPADTAPAEAQNQETDEKSFAALVQCLGEDYKQAKLLFLETQISYNCCCSPFFTKPYWCIHCISARWLKAALLDAVEYLYTDSTVIQVIHCQKWT